MIKTNSLFLESGISLNRTEKAPKEDEENSNAMGRGVRKLSTMFTVFSVREPKNSQVRVTKGLFTHWGRSLNAKI